MHILFAQMYTDQNHAVEELRPVLVEVVLVTKATQDWTAVSVMMATTEMAASVQVCAVR